MEEKKQRYAIGQQDFKSLRERGAVYVDKTQFIEKIIKGDSQYYFLARPRRFGKSLFLSAMRYFFQGERELFKGLHVDSIGYDWQPRPVLYLDLNAGEYTRPDNLDIVIDNLLREWEKKYGIKPNTRDVTTRFRNVIKTAHTSTGRQVIILVDEYDKPLVKNLNKENFEAYREKLAALYSNFKTCADDIQLVFMTGVSRFSKLSVFSGLNNLSDITFDDEFADICGITEDELQKYFKVGITALAQKYKITYGQACARLKKNYDGYRFAGDGSDIYNPWSLLNCLQKREVQNFWNETGFPSLLVEALQRMTVNLEKFFTVYCKADDLKGFDLLDPKPIALMYQTGYLTIKDYSLRLQRYRLGIPNNEVKQGFFDILLPYYVKVKKGTTDMVLNDIITSLILGNPEEFMEALQIFFAGVPYKLKMDNENNFQNAFYLLMSLIGIETDAEVMTSDGSIDLVIKTEDFIYIIELKYDDTPADVKVSLEWADESKTTLRANAKVRFINDIPESDYLFSIALVADGLSNDKWGQSNGYGDYEMSPQYETPYWDLFIGKGSPVMGLEYNDVVVYYKEMSGVEGSLPASIVADTWYEFSYDIPVADVKTTGGDEVVSNFDKTRAVAVVVNGKNGKPLNCASSIYPDGTVPEPMPSAVGSLEESTSVADTLYFDFQGRLVVHPKQGLYIRAERLSDGTLRTSKIRL